MMQSGPPTKTKPQLPPFGKIERLGRIVAVTGAHAIILIDPEGNSRRMSRSSPEIGTLLKGDTPASIALAVVSALSSPMTSHAQNDQELRIVEVEFIGELLKDENG